MGFEKGIGMLNEIHTARLGEERKEEHSRGRAQWWKRI